MTEPTQNTNWADMSGWPMLAEIADHPFLWLIVDTFNSDAWRFLLADEYNELPFDE